MGRGVRWDGGQGFEIGDCGGRGADEGHSAVDSGRYKLGQTIRGGVVGDRALPTTRRGPRLASAPEGDLRKATTAAQSFA